MFNIYNLITKINNGSRLYFNARDKKFYIVNINKNNELCYSFRSFFKDIINDLRFSKIENINLILTKIDEENEKLLSKKISNEIQNTTDLLKEKDYIHKRFKNNFL